MAKYTPLPKVLEGTPRDVIQDLIVATEERFKGDLFGEINSPLNERYTTPDGKLHWSTTKELLNYILDITHTSDIRSANRVLYQNLSRAPEYEAPTMTPAPEYVDANIASKAVRESQEIERASRESKIKESVDKAKRDVNAEIDRQKKLRDDINDRKIYQQIKQEEFVKLKDDQKTALETLRKASIENPKAVENQIESTVLNKLRSTLPQGTSEAEIRTLAKQASVSAVKNLRGESLAQQVAVANEISKNIEVLHRAGISNESASQIINTAQVVANQGALKYQFDRDVIFKVFGEDFAFNVFGPKNLNNLKVILSPAKFDGATQLEVSDISSQYSLNLNQQSIFLDNIKGFGEDEIKEKLLSSAVSWAEKSLPEGVVESALNNQAIRAALDIYGINIGQPIVWEGTTFFGRIAVESGYGPVMGHLGTITGIDFGVGLASGGMVALSASSYAATTTSIAITGGIMASEAFAGGAGTAMAAGAAAGSVVPGAGTLVGGILGFVGGIVGVKVIKVIKDNLYKAKETIIIASVALFGGGIGIATGFGALSGGLIGGLAGLGATKLSSGGLGGLRASANIGAKNVMNIGWAIGATALEGIGGPIITILLVFPLVIALILFIINSGAYIVPPSISSIVNVNEYIDVQKEAVPPGPFENSDLPLKITYNIKIIAKKETLSNITIKDECIVIKESGQQPCQSPPITVPGGTIAVGTPFIFSYEANYNSTYKDALVLNTITVSANVLSETDKQTESGGASITIGKPPSACLSIDGPWPATYKLNLEKAKSKLVGSFSSYVSKVCSSFNKISLLYESGAKDQYWGWNDGQKSGTATLHFYSLGVKNEADALYTLAHELGHSLANGTKTASIYSRYIAFPGIKSEAPYCFYSATTNWNPNESMPEAIALRVVESRCGSVQQKWPIHSSFLKKYVFN